MTRPHRICILVAAMFAFSASGQEEVPGAPAGPPARVVTLDEEKTAVDHFVLEEGETLVIAEDRRIEASGAIVLRGTVRVELPDDAPQGAWAPQLWLAAAERIVITGPMVFGDGRDGTDPGVMGGAGASLNMRAPILAIGIPEIRMGKGGRGGPGAEGGPGGILQFPGWVIPFHPGGLVLAGGRGGDGGDGHPGTELHPRGHRGGDGGGGGEAMQYVPHTSCQPEELPRYMDLAVGADPALDPYLIGPHRVLPPPTRAFGGDGGDGGNGGPPFGPMAEKAGGGRAGDGGGGGLVMGATGLPGSTVTPDDEPAPGVKWTGGRGAYGGDGGDGGDTGPERGFYISATAAGGRGGKGGWAVGGNGGSPGKVDPPPRYWRFEGQAGEGGAGIGGSGGDGGTGHNGGDGGGAGSSQRGLAGDAPPPQPPDDSD